MLYEIYVNEKQSLDGLIVDKGLLLLLLSLLLLLLG